MLEASSRDDDEEGGGLDEGEGEHGSEEAVEKAEGAGLEVKSVVRERNKGVDTGGPERLRNLFGSGVVVMRKRRETGRTRRARRRAELGFSKMCRN
jgi:hypothetical protein